MSELLSGRYELHHGDCFDVFKAIPDGSIDALICDPPYATTQLKWDRPVDWPAFWLEANRVCKSSAVMAMFSAQPFTTDLICSNRKAFRYEIIWRKQRATRFLDANRRPLCGHENILVFIKAFAASTYHPQKEKRENFKPRKPIARDKNPEMYSPMNGAKPDYEMTEMRYPKTVLDFSCGNNKFRIHPTQKPVALMEWLVKSYSNNGDLIFDPFAGSGSTGVAAIQTGRRFIGIEKEAEYCAIAQKRLEEAAHPAQLEMAVSP